jgi:hypothetical protein
MQMTGEIFGRTGFVRDDYFGDGVRSPQSLTVDMQVERIPHSPIATPLSWFCSETPIELWSSNERRTRQSSIGGTKTFGPC